MTDPDSRARTHLANERTFLAWLRTGVTLVALGLAAAEFLTQEPAGLPVVRILATALVVTGAVTVGLGLGRYQQARERIDLEDFRPAGTSLVVSAVVAIVIGVLAAAFVWLGPN